MFQIDFSSDEAIYMQLRNQIIIGIAQSVIKDGQSLPSVRQLASELGVNMHTVNKAYAILRNEGYLKLDRRKGAVVCLDTDRKTQHVATMHVDMKVIVAEAICKDVSLEEMHQMITNMYGEFGLGKEENGDSSIQSLS